MTNLLTVKNLNVTFPGRKQLITAVRDVSFSMGREKLGIVGESGSGKSVTARAILGLVRKPGKIRADHIDFNGINLLDANRKSWKKIRGRRISMVMQDPKYSLNPVMTIGKQISESIRAHQPITHKKAQIRTVEMLAAVKIRNPERVISLYPHEVSGGMGQRIMIAMMLVMKPDLLIADEPTSALDVTVQLQLLAVLDDLVTGQGMGLIFISHDLGLVASFCDRVIIMYGGRIMETCAAKDLHKATHPYTRGLLACSPGIQHSKNDLPVLKRDPSWLDPA